MMLVLVASARMRGSCLAIVRTAVATGARPRHGHRVRRAGGRGAPRRPGRFTLRQKNKTFQPSVLADPRRIHRGLPERRRDLPQRVLAVGAAAVRPRPLPRRRVALHDVRQRRRLPRVLQHPPPDDGAHRGGADAVRDAGGPERPVHAGFAAGTLSADCAVGPRCGGQRPMSPASPAPRPAPELLLDESRFVSLAHKNKHGQDYPAESYKR